MHIRVAYDVPILIVSVSVYKILLCTNVTKIIQLVLLPTRFAREKTKSHLLIFFEETQKLQCQ